MSCVASFFLIFIFSFYCGLSAQARPIKKPHFYKITKGIEVHYLLGTFHYVIRWQDFPDFVHKSFKESRNLILEITLEDSFRKLIHLKLSDIKTPPYPRLPVKYIEKLERLGISEKLFPRNTDANAELYLFFPFSGIYPYYGMDSEIYFNAKDENKKIFTLDTKEMIKESKKHGSSHTLGLTLSRMFDTMTEEQMLSIPIRSMRHYLEGPERISDNTDGGIIYRNKKWMAALLKLLRENNLSFVATGSGHLYGPEGLIEQLRTNGYQVILYDLASTHK